MHSYTGRRSPLRGHSVDECQIIIRKDNAGYFIATCPSLKGCHSYGATLEEALDNIKECILLCQEELEEGGRN
jgi:predicted RNase H-like HicB family nuclease